MVNIIRRHGSGSFFHRFKLLSEIPPATFAADLARYSVQSLTNLSRIQQSGIQFDKDLKRHLSNWLRSGISHNTMATTLAPVDSREVVRCDHCQMVQFRTLSGLCRRCRNPLEREDPPIVEIAPELQVVHVPSSRPVLQVAETIRRLRERAGLSQRQLAMRMGIPRSYISKIENAKARPTLASVERLACALRVPVGEILNSTPNGANGASQLLADEFIAELAPYLSKLTPLQWQSVLAQMRDMTLHTRRSA